MHKPPPEITPLDAVFLLVQASPELRNRPCELCPAGPLVSPPPKCFAVVDKPTWTGPKLVCRDCATNAYHSALATL